MMKKILFMFAFLSVAFVSKAQYAIDPSQKMDIKGSKVYIGGEKLSLYDGAGCFNDINGVNLSDDYFKYRRGYKAGVGMMIGGASAMAVGFVSSVGTLAAILQVVLSGNEVADITTASWYMSYAMMYGGAMVFVAGIPTACVYKCKLNKLQGKYNLSIRGNGIALEF